MTKLAIIGLYMGPGSFGGVNNYSRLLINNIDKNKFDVHYYSLGKSPNWYENVDKPTLLEYEVGLIKKLIFFFFFLKKNRIEVVHLNSGLTQASLLREGILALIAKFSGCKTLFFIHGWKQKEYDNISGNTFKKKILTNILNKQDCIVVLAKQFKEKFIDLGVDFKKIIVSSPMVESEKYIREDKSFSSPYKVLFCANMIKEKGPFEILEAAPTVLTKFPEIKFTFIGNGKDLEILKVRSKEIVIENNVEFTGYVSLEEKIRIFKKSNIFVFPSIYGEGFPVVIIEAMAAGLPVITTPNAGLADAIENDKQGLILNTKPSSIEVANKIIKLLENPNLMKKMSENNIREAKEKYDVKIVTEKMVQIYNHILIDNPVFI